MDKTETILFLVLSLPQVVVLVQITYPLVVKLGVMEVRVVALDRKQILPVLVFLDKVMLVALVVHQEAARVAAAALGLPLHLLLEVLAPLAVLVGRGYAQLLQASGFFMLVVVAVVVIVPMAV